MPVKALYTPSLPFEATWGLPALVPAALGLASPSWLQMANRARKVHFDAA